MTIGSTVGILVGTALAGPAGAAIGGVLGGATETLTGDILTSLGADAIVETTRSIRRRWRPEQRIASETLQSIFRAAVCEAIYDIGGKDVFEDQWLIKRQVSSDVIYWQTEQGQRLRAVDADLAERAENCVRALDRAVQDDSLFAHVQELSANQQFALVVSGSSASDTNALAPLLAYIDRYLENQFESLRQELLPYQFEQHLCLQLSLRVPIHLVELLRQRPDAWRDYQRLLLDTIRNIVAGLAIGQQALNERQNEIISRIDELLQRPNTVPLLLDIQAAVRALEGLVVTEARDVRQALSQDVVGPVVNQITASLGSTQSALEEHINSLRPTLRVFVSKDIYFQPLLQEKLLFSHTEELIGRSTSLDQLLSFTLNNQKIVIVQGQGGIGKSRLLLEFARRFEQNVLDSEIVFLAEGVQLNENNVGSLPPSVRLIVIDDAHRRADTGLLYAFLQQHRKSVQLVLATRPHAIHRIVSELLRSGYDTPHIARLPIIRELSHSDARILAARLLPNESDRTIDRLVAITRDSPLVMILGARLLVERKIDPLLLERDNDFRERVVQTFQDVLLGSLDDTVDAQLSRQLLPVIAAIAPFSASDQHLLLTTSTILGTTIPVLVQTIEGLERAGALQKRSNAVRIVPDVLSDYILHRACVNEEGRVTGYAQFLYQTFISFNPRRLLGNLAELDWRIHQTTEQSSDVLGSIWSDILGQFRTATHQLRCDMISLLGDVAYYQPERTLNLVRIALREPGQDQEGAGWKQYTNIDVLQGLPKLLRYIAYTVSFLPQCYDLLWNLGMDDERPTNQHPDHAMRVLVDIAGYDIDKPWIYQEAAVEAVERWLRRTNIHNHSHSPLKVLDALLEKTAVSEYSDHLTVHMTSFSVPYSATNAIRRRALEIIAQCGRTANLKVVLEAIESLSHALRPPLPYFNMVITDDIREQWYPEEALVMEILSQMLDDHPQPVVQLKVIEALAWHTRNSSSEALRQQAREIIERVPETFELQLTKILGFSHHYIWLLEDDKDSEHQYIRIEEHRSQICRTVALQLINEYAQPVDAVMVINQQLEILQQIDIQTSPLDLIMTISDLSPSFAIQLCQWLIEHPSNNVTPFFAWLLLGIRKKDVSTTLDLQRRALESGNQVLCFSQVSCYRWDVWLNDLQPQDLAIVEGLLIHPNVAVSNAAIGLLRTVGRSQPAFAIQAAMTVEVSENIRRARELCGIFDPDHGVNIALLSREQCAEILNKLVQVRDLSDYHIGMFLQSVSAHNADLVFSFFQARIRHRVEHRDFNYRAIPFEHSIPELTGLDRHPGYSDLLRKVRDCSVEDNAMNANEYIDLFRIVSLNYNNVSLDVLQEWFDSEEEDKLIGAARLLREAPRGFLFSHLGYIERILEQAYDLGDDCFSQVGHYVSYCEIYGSRSGTPGQPFPEDVQLRAQAYMVLQRLSQTSPLRSFYERLVSIAEQNIQDTIMRDEELLDD